MFLESKRRSRRLAATPSARKASAPACGAGRGPGIELADQRSQAPPPRIEDSRGRDDRQRENRRSGRRGDDDR